MTKKILYIDSEEHCSLPRCSLKVIAADFDIDLVTTKSEALGLLKAHPGTYRIIVSNVADLDIFSAARQYDSNIENVLVTDQPIKDYSFQLEQKEHQILDHIIANRSETDWTIQELRVTIQKIMRDDIFGIEKYLAPGTEVQQTQVTCTKERDMLNTKVMSYAESYNLGQHTAKLLFGITEELLMNALYDAPAAAGITEYSILHRSESFSLRPHEYGTLSYGCDGDLFAVSVADPFGVLQKETLLQYIKKVQRRHEGSGLIDSKKGGAGLGFFKILYSSHALICNVDKGKKTEIIAIIDLREYLRDFDITPRSIHFFGTASA
jgi:hypothetical protein